MTPLTAALLATIVGGTVLVAVDVVTEIADNRRRHRSARPSLPADRRRYDR